MLTRVVHSIEEIARSDWNRCFGAIAEGYDYYRVLERSGLKEFEFQYVVVTADGATVAIAPIFSGDLDLAIGVEGVVEQLVGWIRRWWPRFLIVKTLFCGSPFGEEGVIGLSATADAKGSVVRKIAQQMRARAREMKLRFILFKDFPARARDLLSEISREGFFSAPSFPNVRAELPFSSIEEYFNQLSYSRRKELRRKLKKANSDGRLRVKEVRNVEDCIDRIYELYEQTLNAGTVSFERLTKTYFLEVTRLMPEQCWYFLYYLDDRLICFNLCFEDAEGLTDKFIGFDYRIARERNLYFYSWVYNVEWCIRRRLKHYQVGQTDYAAKLDLGGKVVPLDFYARHANPVYHVLLKVASRAFAPRDPSQS